MNRGTVVRMDADVAGATLRVWVDDEAGHHLTVAEISLSVVQVASLAVEIERAQQKSEQYQLAFDY